jgi:hypothetical protein
MRRDQSLVCGNDLALSLTARDGRARKSKAGVVMMECV